MDLVNRLTALRDFFNSGATRPADFRRMQLKKLKAALEQYENEIYRALQEDLKKSPEESWVTENGFILAEINHALRHLDNWMKPVHVPTNLVNLPSKSFVLSEPKGVVLVIGPWNYPVQLLINPVVGAIAAGNCIVIKPSEFAPATAAVLRQLLKENFDERYILFAEGEGADLIPEMMNNFIFDHVFFTGSTEVGKLIYRMAAANLVPVTLELGGKTPCVVEQDANLKVAARRIAVSKFSNAGQMCVAPDYVLVHESVKDSLISELKRTLLSFYGENPAADYNYGKIINTKQFDRLVKLLSEGTVIHGGRNNREELFIEPALITGVTTESAIMQDEIFGPLLPVLTFSTMDEALRIISRNRDPLAFYIFTSSAASEKKWLDSVAFGGGCVNNTGWHLTNYNLPFGGRGTSGTGNCHGKFSFDTFSHKKGIMKTPAWFDPSIKYPPFKGKLKLFKWFVR